MASAHAAKTNRRFSMKLSQIQSHLTRSISTNPPVAGYPERRKLYKHHVPTSSLQKAALAISSAFTVLRDPTRADMLATLGDVTSLHTLRSIHQSMCSDTDGQEILIHKPRVSTSTVDFASLESLPADTFGASYYKFMKTHGFNPNDRAAVKYVDDPELAYVMSRFREMHDFWHVLFDIPPTEFGEIILKVLELNVTKLPVCGLSALVGPVRLTSEERRLLFTHYIPWAATTARNCKKNLLYVYYEKEFNTPLDKLRESLGVSPV